MAIVSHTVLARVFQGTLALLITSPFVHAQSFGSAQSRMKPLGSPSAVDQYRSRSGPALINHAPVRQVEYRSSQNQSAVRQAAMMQDTGGMSIPPGAMQNPGAVAPPSSTGLPDPTTLPGAAVPSNSVPGVPARALPVPSNANPIAQTDQTLIPKPQLSTAFATQDNCNLVTPASGYSAAFGNNCGTVQQTYIGGTPQPIATTPLANNPMGFAVPPAEIARPAIMPPNRQGAAPIRSLFTLGQEVNSVQVGQGLWGQPKAYVISQPVRNWVRYFFP